MKITSARTAVLESSMEELRAILQHARELGLAEKESATLEALVDSYALLLEEIGDKQATLSRLRRLLFGATTEKTQDVVGTLGDSDPTGAAASPPVEGGSQPSSKPKPPGHGRIAAAAYTGLERVKVPHPTLEPGDACPHCQGKLYEKKPEVLLRIRGCAPLSGSALEKQRLRCHLCGKLWVAPSPAGVGEEKFDETVASMIGLLRYGSGLPFHRIAGLQQAVGIPLPASTQWELVEQAAGKIQPAFEELLRQAAQGQVLYNDDTSMTILDHVAQNRRHRQAEEKPPERTGTFTSGIVSQLDGRSIVVYLTGRRHAGENLTAVLARRASGLDPPIQMCDGLERNLPAELSTIVGNCLAHGRRKFVEVVGGFPAEVGHVLGELAVVYRNEAEAKQKGLSKEERLRLHQEESGPVMEGLKSWLAAQIEEKKVEPSSTLGKAIAYLTKRWDRLTLFLRQADAPLDNNLCERILKKAILHRKNSLFYKTENGAQVGDLYMSLIASAKLAGVNPFDYLTELQRHAAQVAATPADWLPWSYRATLGSAAPLA